MEEKIYDTIPYPNFKFSEVVNRKAKDYCSMYLRNENHYEPDEDIPVIENALWNFSKTEDRVQFTIYLINYITEVLAKHLSVCTANRCSVEPNCQEFLFFLYRKLDEFGLKTDADSFTTDEVFQNNEVINQILYKLEEIKGGQEIIFEEVESLKKDFSEAKGLQVLGKSKWHKYIAGIVFENLANKGIDDVLKQLIPYLKELINVSKLMLNQ